MPESDRPQHIYNALPITVIVCTVVIFFTMVVAQVAVGIVYDSDCPRQPFIPNYLLGFVFILLLPACWEKCNEICHFLIIVFYLVWFIAGNVAIYSVYEPNYNKNTTKVDSYCNKTLYLFAFWTTNFTYVLFGVILFSFCRCKTQVSDDEASLLQTDK